jgi:hypothetical protein
MVKAADKAGALPKARTIPNFESEDEERAWWASHDTSELPGEDVEMTYTGPRPEPPLAGARRGKETLPPKAG